MANANANAEPKTKTHYARLRPTFDGEIHKRAGLTFRPGLAYVKFDLDSKTYKELIENDNALEVGTEADYNHTEMLKGADPTHIAEKAPDDLEAPKRNYTADPTARTSPEDASINHILAEGLSPDEKNKDALIKRSRRDLIEIADAAGLADPDNNYETKEDMVDAILATPDFEDRVDAGQTNTALEDENIEPEAVDTDDDSDDEPEDTSPPINSPVELAAENEAAQKALQEDTSDDGEDGKEVTSSEADKPDAGQTNTAPAKPANASKGGRNYNKPARS